MNCKQVPIGSLEHSQKGSFRIGPFGSSLKKSELVPQGIPVAGIENIVTGVFQARYRRFITEKKYDELAHYTIQPGDVLVTTMGTIGRAAVVPDEIGTAIMDSHLFRMRLDTTKVLPKYLVYALNHFHELRKQIERKARGAIMSGLNTTILKECTIPLPPLPVQMRLVAILEKADAAREKRRQSLALTDQFLQSAFLEMFGDPVTNPKGWEVKTLQDCCVGAANNGFFAKSHSYGDSGVPIVWISDFIDKFYVQSSELKRVRINEKDVDKYLVKYGDVLFCRSSLNHEGIGKAAIVPRNLANKTIFECHIIRVTLDQSKLVPEFFRVLADTKYFRMQIETNSKTSTMTTIGQDGIVSNTVIVPPLSEQQKFAALVEKVEALRARQRQSEKELDTLFQSLMQRAFKGELVSE